MTRAVRTATAGLVGLAVLLLLLAGVGLLTAPDTTVPGTVGARGWNLAGPCQPTVEYAVNGRTYRTTPSYDEAWCAGMRRGTMPVWVDPDSPADGRLDRYGRLPGLLGAGAAATVLLAGLVVTLARRQALRRTPPWQPGPVPRSVGVLALACLAAQTLVLARGDLTSADEAEVLVAMLLGGLVVGWVSAGVLRARGVRTVLAWGLLLANLVLAVDALLDAIGLRELATTGADVALAVVQLGALAWFASTPWAAWHRAHPRTTSATAPTIEHIVVIAVLVGVLAALAAPSDDAFIRFHLQL